MDVKAAPRFPGLWAVMPALDEEGSVGGVVAELLAMGVEGVLVADNGSRDRTAAVAEAAGASVVAAPVRGYGAACLAALAGLPRNCRAVVFCDADGADELARLPELAGPVLVGECDLVIGSRVLGGAEPGALTPPQRAGNLVASTLMRLLYRVRVTDLGPFRCCSCALLKRLAMRDPAYGWTAEMQVKAYRLGARVREVAVLARARRAGTSKISGRFVPVLRAGWAIMTTVLRYRFARMEVAPERHGSDGTPDAVPSREERLRSTSE
jgi:glycosyltransferase involved in cell wall biosynthesis